MVAGRFAGTGEPVDVGEPAGMPDAVPQVRAWSGRRCETMPGAAITESAPTPVCRQSYANDSNQGEYDDTADANVSLLT